MHYNKQISEKQSNFSETFLEIWKERARIAKLCSYRVVILWNLRYIINLWLILQVRIVIMFSEK